MKRITIEVPKETSQALDTLVRNENEYMAGNDGFCSHGYLTVEKLLEMLAEDAGMVETRPGSWEGAGMAEVLARHGYYGN